MTDLPECWPPPEQPEGDGKGWLQGAEVPLFPLADVWLYPGAVLPLFIFEPRYREMIEDSLDGPGRLVIGTVEKGHEEQMPGAPPVYPVAGLGEIGRHERRADGCYVILLVGLSRVNLDELKSERQYRRVRVDPLAEIPVCGERETDLRERLMAAVQARVSEAKKLPAQLPVANLADFLMLRMSLPHAITQKLYAEPCVATRAEGILAEHAQRPIEGGSS